MTNILLIEDNEVIRVSLKEILERLWPHLQILEADDGCYGLEMALAEYPVLILVDGRLPHLNGDQIAHTLRHIPSTHDIPIIGVTNEGMDSPTRQALSRWCNAIVTKPFRVEQIQETIRPFLITPGLVHG